METLVYRLAKFVLSLLRPKEDSQVFLLDMAHEELYCKIIDEGSVYTTSCCLDHDMPQLCSMTILSRQSVQMSCHPTE